MTVPFGATHRLHFVTGKLAEPALQEVVHRLHMELGFAYSIQKMPITVAALMTARWMLRHLEIPPGTTHLVLPGYLELGLDEIRQHPAIQPLYGLNVICGPKDLRDLPSTLGSPARRNDQYGAYSIEILAEINHANRLDRQSLLEEALRLQQAGADIIDLGCDPGSIWLSVGEAVRALCDAGLRVSIDSFEPVEVQAATQAGASLVLSVHKGTVHHAVDWGTEVVLIPETLERWEQDLEESIPILENAKVPFRLDPILEPIGCGTGFAQSLHRYFQTRQRYPKHAILMGIGNITELTDGDSAAMNTLLLGYCQELDIRSVLTTQVINWARSSVQECDLARRLVHAAVHAGIPPKHLEPQLVLLRDPKLREYPTSFFEHLAATITDHNYRILVASNEIHLLAANVYVRGTDPYAMVEELMRHPNARPLDASHAFYLGFEMAKALTALQLHKQYEQDQALHWGFLTRHEVAHRLPRN